MATTESMGRHLDATGDREVVYCHACHNEWFRDDREDHEGLSCPVCEADATEIVCTLRSQLLSYSKIPDLLTESTQVCPDSDPREITTPSPTSSTSQQSRDAEDSDPEEADIEDHTGQRHTLFTRSVRSGPEDEHHNPAVDPMFERFYDVFHTLGQPRRTEGAEHFHPTRDNYGPSRIQRTTFTTGSIGRGTASVTIVSGSTFGNRLSDSGGMHNREYLEDDDPFQA